MTGLRIEDVGAAPEAISTIAAEHTARVAATLDVAAPVEGQPLPLLWHWAFFTPTAPSAGLGADGHPRIGAEAATTGLPRRMWAGGRVRQAHPLVVGERAVRRSDVIAAERKSGRSGDLLVVTARHEVEQGGRVVLVEEQDLVYRAPSPSPLPLPDAGPAPEPPAGGWVDERSLTPPVLVRYSAVTFNAHRIHYDLAYAQDEEGYPALVVHGPLTATLLAESARRRGWSGSSFEFRASAPLFAPSTVHLVGRCEAALVELQAVRNDGTVAMTATLT
jgi:hydroxyacyl-ACP dehydratase HTD2-like protein with hotdog domain